MDLPEPFESPEIGSKEVDMISRPEQNPLREQGTSFYGMRTHDIGFP